MYAVHMYIYTYIYKPLLVDKSYLFLPEKPIKHMIIQNGTRLLQYDVVYPTYCFLLEDFCFTT